MKIKTLLIRILSQRQIPPKKQAKVHPHSQKSRTFSSGFQRADKFIIKITGRFHWFWLQKVKNTYRRYFETSIVVTAEIYVLAIIEASVAAHLKTFDISDDISFRVEPRMSQPLVRQPVAGIRIVFSFR